MPDNEKLELILNKLETIEAKVDALTLRMYVAESYDDAISEGPYAYM